jgi:hypothetical protein
MIDLIKKTICPPGIEKPNRFALFSVVSEVMSRVRADAEKAFYAHFPYLADDKKLDEHGEALLIPHLPNDTPEEYRNRVATASFFLMRAGERAYIMEQLKERFGDRFIIDEQFLSIHTKVTELTDDERVWVLNLFDSLVDPNIYLELSELYNFVEKVMLNETIGTIRVKTQMADCPGYIVFRDGTKKRNGQYQRKYIGVKDNISITVRNDFQDKLYGRTFRSGVFRRDGTIKRGFTQNLATEKIIADMHLENVDRITLAEQFDFFVTQGWTDTLDKQIKRNGNIRRNGTATRAKQAIDIQRIEINVSLIDTVTINESFSIGYRKYDKRNGVHKRNGTVKRNNNVFIPL